MNAPTQRPSQNPPQSGGGTPWVKILGCAAVVFFGGMIALCFGAAVLKVFVFEDEAAQSDPLAIDGDETELEVYEIEAEELSSKSIEWIAAGEVDKVMSLFPEALMTDASRRQTRSFLEEHKYLVANEEWDTDAGRTYTSNLAVPDDVEFAFNTDGGPVLYDVTMVASRKDDPRILTLDFRWTVLEQPDGSQKLALLTFDAKKQTRRNLDVSRSGNEVAKNASSATSFQNGWVPYEKSVRPDFDAAMDFFAEYIGHLRSGDYDKAYELTLPAFQTMVPKKRYNRSAERLREVAGDPKSLTTESLTARPASTEHIWKDKSRVPLTVKAIFVQDEKIDGVTYKLELAAQQRFDFRTTPPSPIGEFRLNGQLRHEHK